VIRRNLSLAVIAVALSGCGRDDSPPQVRERLQAVMIQADSTAVVGLILGDTMHLSPGTVELYRSVRYRPAWIRGGKLAERGQQLHEVIGQSAQDGLDPRRYRHDIAMQLLNALDGEGESELGADARARYLADLDLLLTEGFVRYAADLSDGTVDPKSAGIDWRIAHNAAPVPRDIFRRLVRDRVEPKTVIAELRPGAPHYYRLAEALARLRTIESRGGWPKVVGTASPGDSNQVVAQLRARLAASEDPNEARLAAAGAQRAMVFDSSLHAALKHFQERHSIEGDGALGEATLEELNYTVQERIAEVALNLDRWRWMPDNLGELYVIVNVAGFELEVVENDQPIEQMNVVVGKPGWDTPVFSDTMEHLVVNPYWNVPPSIYEEEIAPALARDPAYLERNNMERTSNGSVRQRPGPENALGRFKFLFPNGDDIYLHDTPAGHLFSRASRAFSHGCIRLERPEDLARLLLTKASSRPESEIDNALATTSEKWIPFDRKIPIYITYFTTWVERDGTLRYHHDVYGLDEQLQEKRQTGSRVAIQ